jgi:hypothetical protein
MSSLLLNNICTMPSQVWHPMARVSHPQGLRGGEFCTICPFFAHFSTFTKIAQVPSAHSPVKSIFRTNPKNARKSQNTPSTKPYQNDTQFSPSSLKNATSWNARTPKSAICPPVNLPGKTETPKKRPSTRNKTQFPLSSLKNAKFRHGTAGLSNVEVSPMGQGETEN